MDLEYLTERRENRLLAIFPLGETATNRSDQGAKAHSNGSLSSCCHCTLQDGRQDATPFALALTASCPTVEQLVDKDSVICLQA